MRNVWTICSKELKSYFTSPIAYLLMALFGLIFGYFFFSATVFFVNAGLRAQMGGQQQPMSINEYVISPLLGNASVVGLFLIPLISMRLFAEEKQPLAGGSFIAGRGSWLLASDDSLLCREAGLPLLCP